MSPNQINAAKALLLRDVTEALADTIKKLSGEIEELQAKGLAPADYSLGFTNGLLFVHHRLTQNTKRPRFYDRKTAIGILPMPVKFQHEVDAEVADELAYEERLETLVGAVRAAIHTIENGPYAHPSFTDLLVALQDYNRFIEEKEQKYEQVRATKAGEKLLAVSQADEGSEGQGNGEAPAASDGPIPREESKGVGE